ncbi:MAG: putative porin [Candidatus Margulisiibacteriota bacterium]
MINVKRLAPALVSFALATAPKPVLAQKSVEKRVQVNGDFRLRYQWEKARDDDSARGRERFRARVGFTADVSEAMTFGLRLATGGADPRSNNQTMTSAFDSPEIRLTQAYGNFHPFSWLEMQGGKFTAPAWTSSDGFWDHDLNPEGVAFNLNSPTAKKYRGFPLFFNLGAYVLNEIKDKPDPWLAVPQAGLNFQLDDRKSYVRFAAAYYNFHNLKGTFLDYSSLTNSRTEIPGAKEGETIKAYANNGDYFLFNGEASVNSLDDVNIRLWGEYLHNVSTSTHRSAYIVGTGFGFSPLFNFSFAYRLIRQDALLDLFPDSDFNGGKTNVRGYELIVNSQVHKNISLGFDFYHSNLIEGKSNPLNLAQFDVNLKF